MKNNKKILALMMTALMIMSLIPFAMVSAESAYEVTIGTVTADPGTVVVVPVSLSVLPYQTCAATIKINYDQTKLTLNSIQPVLQSQGGIIYTTSDLETVLGIKPAPGVLRLFYADSTSGGMFDTHIKNAGLFANLTFTVSADASGSYPLTVQTNHVSYFTDVDVEDHYTVTSVAGAVNVQGAATATPEPTPVPPTATPEPTAEPATATPEPTPVPDHTITVSVDDTKGMVLNMATGKAVLNGQTVAVADGADAQFKVVSYKGYKIDQVIYNGGAPAGNGMFKNVVNTGAVTADATLSATFGAFTPGNDPVVDSYDKVFTATENSEPIAVSYGTVHGTYAAAGIIMWNADDSAVDVTLEQALAAVPTVDSNRMYVFSATSGTVSKGLNTLGQFGVKVKNLPVGTYKMRTYVLRFEKVTYGETETFTIN